MTAGSDFADAVRGAWERQWPQRPPVADWLRVHYAERWVRFHSLPGSKRYADNAGEYLVILDRHNTVLDELAPGESLTVITCDWSAQDAALTNRSGLLARVDPHGVHWCTVQPDPDDDPDFRVYWHLFASARDWHVGALDGLLRAVADDELFNVIVGPPDLRWLYHPYDGGADVILPSTADRDRLRQRYLGWLSQHPGGL